MTYNVVAKWADGIKEFLTGTSLKDAIRNLEAAAADVSKAAEKLRQIEIATHSSHEQQVRARRHG